MAATVWPLLLLRLLGAMLACMHGLMDMCGGTSERIGLITTKKVLVLESRHTLSHTHGTHMVVVFTNNLPTPLGCTVTSRLESVGRVSLRVLSVSRGLHKRDKETKKTKFIFTTTTTGSDALASPLVLGLCHMWAYDPVMMTMMPGVWS